jgi:hypothetical protein
VGVIRPFLAAKVHRRIAPVIRRRRLLLSLD